MWNRSDHNQAEDFWSVLAGPQIIEASKNIKRFSTYRAGIWLNPDTLGPLEIMRNVVLFKDPPEQTKFRAIFQSAFTPKTTARLEGSIRHLIVELLDRAAATGSMDVVTALSIPLPLMVIADLLGAPLEDLDKLGAWTTAIDEGIAQGIPNSVGLVALGEMAEYFSGLLDDQADARDTLVGALYRAEVDGEKLNADELKVFLGILLFGGNDTTRNAISHGFRLFCEHPDQFAALAAAPELIPNAVEEILRMATPLNYFARTATEDTELGGVPVTEGQRLVLWYCAGSRDPQLFPDPDRFDITRTPGNHQAFGGGRHYCLGAPLARLELRILLEEVIRRLGQPVLAGPVRTAGSVLVNGLASLPITYTPTASRPGLSASK